MIIKLILCLLVVVRANPANSDCKEVRLNNKPHKKHVIGMGLNRPYQLAYDLKEHKVFFSYNIGDDSEDTFQIGYIKKDHIKHEDVPDVRNGFAIAVDNKDNIIFFGGSDGIYEQHLKPNSTVQKIVRNHNIWDMFFKHHLYFINYPSQHLFKCIRGKHGIETEHQKHIHEKIYQFVIDGDDDTFITNETGLYRIKNATNHRIFYGEPTIFRAIEVNNKGVAYFSAKDGIFVANKTSNTLEIVAHMKNIFGLAFDKDDNIIYSSPYEIIKLLPERCK
ncbi:ommochrome-binding protein-like [Maniola hyperantus]|uniref:ommochrome-binding protein-like n=1 Tax=Aphantopus hyperantus TaxID=2795564 RepID=UPI0015680E1C|nr:ommochrome-binding protein-like [Maniola hyperantus]